MSNGSILPFADVTTWAFPLWGVAAGVVVVLLALLLISVAVRFAFPQIGAIAHTTAKEAMSQPIFFLLIALGIFALVMFTVVAYNTLGEDLKVLKMEGLTIIKVLAVILALWTASMSISDEIEGRTALTLLSKPIHRYQLILGKFLGILVPVVILFVILGAFFMCTVSYKVVFEARENSAATVTWQQCQAEMIQVAPGTALAFMETVMLTAVGVAISTRLSMLPNLIICAVVYVLGHLIPTIIDASAGRFEVVGFFGKLLAAVLPVLDHFQIETAIAMGQTVPLSYVGMAAVYMLVYSAAAVLLALLLFEDRDVA
jgi:ABC-type transport system involved in multi-copper enzyme maturation permease subunit